MPVVRRKNEDTRMNEYDNLVIEILVKNIERLASRVTQLEDSIDKSQGNPVSLDLRIEKLEKKVAELRSRSVRFKT